MRASRSLPVSLRCALPALGLTASLSAPAQPHVHESGDHLLRASTVSAETLPPAMRKQHAIPLDPHTAVLNVTVQRQVDGTRRNVPAAVEVHARNLLGVQTPVPMRETVANGMVSYLGVYRFQPRQALDFRIAARPAGSDERLVLEFRDRLGWR